MNFLSLMVTFILALVFYYDKFHEKHEYLALFVGVFVCLILLGTIVYTGGDLIGLW